MEENLIDTAKSVLSGSLQKSVGSDAVKPNGLSPIQQHRHDYLFPIYGEQTAVLIPLIEGRGKNSWLKINEKIDNLLKIDYSAQDYIDELYDNFELDKLYTVAEITGIIGEARRKFGLKAFTSRMKFNCEEEFFKLFIVEDIVEHKIVDGKEKKVFIGYKAKFKLLPEE